MTRWLGGLLAIALAGPAVAQDAGSADADAFAEVQQAHMMTYSQGDYLGALEALEEAPETAAGPMLDSMRAQFMPSLDGFVLADPGRAAAFGPQDRDAAERLSTATMRDALEAIVEAARDTRIVIINEAHDNPRDRAFVLEVAEAIRSLGYTHYAAETLQNCCSPEESEGRMAELAARSYPTFSDGYYSSEPMFGYLLRGVLELGFRPVAYEWISGPGGQPESMEETVRLREAAQAENLARALEAADSDAKFLIHVGYSHAAEVPLGGQPWMAAQLKALTGIDPLSVDQTFLSEYARPALHERAALAPGSAPLIPFIDGEGAEFGPFPGAMDLHVIHPPIQNLGGRPDWLARTGRRAVPVPRHFMPQTGRALVQVFVSTDGADAVSVDQVLVEAGDEAPLLYVPDGDYRIAAQRPHHD